jgi:hypothetical protein
MSRHHTEDIEALEEAKDAPGRYRTDVRKQRGPLYEVQLVTTHVIRPVGEHGEPLPTWNYTTELERPPIVLTQRWAQWKARRMVAAAHRRDVREQQPWAVQR